MDLTHLPDNNLSHIISYLDYKSAIIFTASTSKCLSVRTSDSLYYCHLWRQSFIRHGFSLPDDKNTKDYKRECKKRLQLFRNLTKGHGESSLPNRYFSFVPITPNDDEYYDDDDDELFNSNSPPPSVDFECSSFALTTPGISGELLFLDPFNGALVLQECCTDQRDPSQILLCFDDYVHTDLSEYFYLGWNNNIANNAVLKCNVILRENEEVEIDFVGIDAKPILRNNGAITGTMAAVSRSFCGESGDGEELKVCTEIITWKRTDGKFGERSVCRFRNSYKRMEIDPVFERVYVLFPFHEGPFRSFDTLFLSNEEMSEEGFVGGSSVIAVYPLEAYPETSYDVGDDEACNCKYTEPKHFPEPNFLLKCSNPVSALNVAPGGELILIGTIKGDLEIWETGKGGNATRRNVLNITASLKGKKFGIHNNTLQKDNASCSEVETNNSRNNDAITSPATPATEEIEETDEIDSRPTSGVTISSFHFASHRTIDEAGFVTLHYIHGKAWVFIWNKNFEIGATINLPLSARRKPRIHFDGRRLIVCGQQNDSCGMILLVYHVLNTWEDLDSFHEINSGEDNGGVQDGDDVVKFVNDIQHDELGGMEYYDSVYMTANERYVVINTKSGNLINEAQPMDGIPKSGNLLGATDGLLVIDLQDH